MSKVIWKPGTLLSPLPAVFVGCGDMEKPNLITVAWTGIINSDPAMTYVSIRPSRHSHKLIEESGEFTINLASCAMARKLDQCGVYTGAKVDKFKKFNLTPIKSVNLNAPIIDESPLSLECKVRQKLSLGSHDMFLAEILSVDVEDSLINDKGKLCLEKANLLAYSHGDYLALGRKIGSFGYSVKKRNHHTKNGGKK